MYTSPSLFFPSNLQQTLLTFPACDSVDRLSKHRSSGHHVRETQPRPRTVGGKDRPRSRLQHYTHLQPCQKGSASSCVEILLLSVRRLAAEGYAQIRSHARARIPSVEMGRADGLGVALGHAVLRSYIRFIVHFTLILNTPGLPVRLMESDQPTY